MDFSTFAAGLSSSPAGIVLLCGEEGYFREKGVQLLKPRATGGYLRLSSSETTWPGILDELYTPSLLGGTKLLAVADEGTFFHNHAADLAAYAKSPSPSAVLAALIPGKTPALTGKGVAVVECRPLKGLDLSRWVAAEFQRRGKTADRACVQLLIGRCGGELTALDRYADSLVQHAGSRPSVTEDDVRLLVADQASHEIYELALATAAKKMGKAMEILHRLLAGREAPPVLLWKLAWQYRKLVEGRKMLEAGVPPGTIPPQLQITYYGDEFLGLVRSHTFDELVAKHGKILEADLALKSSGGHESLLMERLVCELSSDKLLVS